MALLLCLVSSSSGGVRRVAWLQPFNLEVISGVGGVVVCKRNSDCGTSWQATAVAKTTTAGNTPCVRLCDRQRPRNAQPQGLLTTEPLDACARPPGSLT